MIDYLLKEALWKQFGASIDMLEQSLVLCPDELWNTKAKFWYNAYHCLFWLDYYLTVEPENFTPRKPFTLSEFEPNGTMPPEVYSKQELLSYLHESRKKCRDLISSLTEDLASKRWINERKNYSLLEMLVYNMRHVQHHVAQLNLLLRQEINDAPKWISQTEERL